MKGRKKKGKRKRKERHGKENKILFILLFGSKGN